MKHIRIITTIMSIIFANTTFATQVIPHQVNPQIGQNLWQMNYNQSITIDDILDTTTLCCNCDFFITQADIDLNSGGFTIAQSGNWCLAEDIFTTAPIIISAPSVSFDLKGRIITGTDTGVSFILVVESTQDVSVKNGTIIGIDLGAASFFRTGLLVTDSTNILIENMSVSLLGSIDSDTLSQENTGFASEGNTIFRSCFATGPFLTGFKVEGTNIGFYNCEVNHFSGDLINGGTETRAGIGYIINGSDHYLENCTSIGSDAQPGFDSAGSTGFYILSPNTILDNCTALNHKNAFETPTTGIPAGYGFYIEGDNCQIIKGNATNNDQDGILIDADRSLLDQCTTVTNGSIGINMVSGDGSIIRNCDASYNTTVGINIVGNNVAIEDCTASSNGSISPLDIGIYLDSGSGATIRNCTCNLNLNGGIAVNTQYFNISIDGCVTNMNAITGISIAGNGLSDVNGFINNCTAQHNGLFGIMAGFTNNIQAEYVAVGTYSIPPANDQNIRIYNNLAQGNGSRDIIMWLTITDPLNVQPTIPNTPRLVSPPIGICGNARGALDWDQTVGSSLVVGQIPLSPGIGANTQFSN